MEENKREEGCIMIGGLPRLTVCIGHRWLSIEEGKMSGVETKQIGGNKDFLCQEAITSPSTLNFCSSV